MAGGLAIASRPQIDAARLPFADGRAPTAVAFFNPAHRPARDPECADRRPPPMRVLSVVRDILGFDRQGGPPVRSTVLRGGVWSLFSL